MSALGQKQTFAAHKPMSALPPKADMCGATRDVRFVPKADYDWDHPLKSGPRSGVYRLGAAPSYPAASHKARAERIDLEFELKCRIAG